MKANIEKTRAFYCKFPPECICDCAYCRNYRARVREAYPEVAEYLAKLGVDIEKPFEISPLEPDENGYLEYCVCQYIVLGTCPQDFSHQIGEVKFGISDSRPSTGIDEDHFVLNFYPIKLRFETSEGESGNL